MRTHLFALSVAALLGTPLSTPEPAGTNKLSPHLSTRGVVALRKRGCDYFVVATGMGYDLLEWYGGSDPSEGDELTGEFERYGFHDIYNITAGRELKVWVEDYWLSKERVIEKLYAKCD